MNFNNVGQWIRLVSSFLFNNRPIVAQNVLIFWFFCLCNLAVLHCLPTLLQLLQSLLFPNINLIFELFQRNDIGFFERLTIEWVLFCRKKSTMDSASIDNIFRTRKHNWIFHKLNNDIFTVLIKAQRYLSGISP